MVNDVSEVTLKELSAYQGKDALLPQDQLRAFKVSTKRVSFEPSVNEIHKVSGSVFAYRMEFDIGKTVGQMHDLTVLINVADPTINLNISTSLLAVAALRKDLFGLGDQLSLNGEKGNSNKFEIFLIVKGSVKVCDGT